MDVGFAGFTNDSPAASITILLCFFLSFLFSISSMGNDGHCMCAKKVASSMSTMIWRADDLVWDHYSYKCGMNESWCGPFLSRDDYFANYSNEVGQYLSALIMRKPQMQSLMNGMRNKSINSSCMYI